MQQVYQLDVIELHCFFNLNFKISLKMLYLLKNFEYRNSMHKNVLALVLKWLPFSRLISLLKNKGACTIYFCYPFESGQ